MDTKMHGTRLAAQRRRLGWTQAELAEKLGVAVTTISRWETRTYKPSKWLRAKLQQTLVDGTTPQGKSQAK